MIKVRASRIGQCMGPVNTLIPEGCYEKEAFWHSSNQIFQSQSVPKDLRYEADVFLQNARKFM